MLIWSQSIGVARKVLETHLVVYAYDEILQINIRD